MRFWPFGGLPGVILKTVQGLVNKQSQKLLKRLWEVRDTTLGDLANGIGTVFQKTNLYTSCAFDHIEYPDKEGRLQYLFLETFPVQWLEHSQTLSAVVKKHLASNSDLLAAKASANVSQQDWDTLIDQYGDQFVKYATSYALARLMKSKTLLLQDLIVLAVENEPYNIGGTVATTKMVKLYKLPAQVDPNTAVKKAHKIWEQRRSQGFTYKQDVHGKKLQPTAKL